MSQPDPVNRLNEAITLMNAGQRAEARTILLELSWRYPAMELVWLWLASVTDDTDERIGHLKKVLEIHPHNQKARTALTRLTGVEPPPPPPPPATAAPLSSAALPSTRTIETVLIVVLALIALTVVVVVLISLLTVVLTPQPTPTPTRTPTLTP